MAKLGESGSTFIFESVNLKRAEVIMFIYCTKKLTLKMSIVGKRVPSEKLDMTNDARHDSNPGRRNSKGLLPLSEKTES